MELGTTLLIGFNGSTVRMAYFRGLFAFNFRTDDRRSKKFLSGFGPRTPVARLF
jgi:hypothetical protein